jgi:hypothetical protein
LGEKRSIVALITVLPFVVETAFEFALDVIVEVAFSYIAINEFVGSFLADDVALVDVDGSLVDVLVVVGDHCK